MKLKNKIIGVILLILFLITMGFVTKDLFAATNYFEKIKVDIYVDNKTDIDISNLEAYYILVEYSATEDFSDYETISYIYGSSNNTGTLQIDPEDPNHLIIYCADATWANVQTNPYYRVRIWYYDQLYYEKISEVSEILTEGELYEDILTNTRNSNSGSYTNRVTHITTNLLLDEKEHTFNISNIWNDFDNEDGLRPESIKIQILSQSINGPTLLKEIELNESNSSQENPNLWKAEEFTLLTPETNFIFELIYPDKDLIQYKKDQTYNSQPPYKTHNIEFASSIGKKLAFTIEKKWHFDDYTIAGEYPSTIRLYGTNSQEDANNRVNGELLYTTTLSPDNPAYDGAIHDWQTEGFAYMKEFYNYYYVEQDWEKPESDTREFAPMTYTIEINDDYYNDDENYQYMNIEVHDIELLEKEYLVTWTWNDENNKYGKRDENVKFNHIENYFNEKIIYPIEFSQEDDLYIDDNLQTRQFKRILKLPVYAQSTCTIEDMPEIEKYYNVSSSSGVMNDGTYVLNVTATYVGQNHQIDIVYNWDDNNNEAGKRPESVTIDFYGSDRGYYWDYGKPELVENIVLTAENAVEGNPNQWKISLPIKNYKHPYIVIRKATYEGDPDYFTINYYTTTSNFSSVENTEDTETKYWKFEATSAIGYTYNFSIEAEIEDYNNYYELRPETLPFKIYGTNNEDLSKGEFIYEDTLPTTSYHYFKPLIPERYEYFYAEFPETIETEKGIYVLRKIHYQHEEYDKEYDRIYIKPIYELQLEKTITITQIWDDLSSPPNSRPDSVDFKITAYESYLGYVDIATLTLTKDDAIDDNTWQKTFNILTGYEYLTIKQEFANIGYSDPEIEITNVLKDDNITLKYSITSKNIFDERTIEPEFRIIKTWEDFDNKYLDRPEKFTLEIYGTNIENDFENGILLKTIELNQINDLNNDNNPNTWEFIIEDIRTTASYFYAKEKNGENEDIYKLTNNTITQETGTNITKIDILQPQQKNTGLHAYNELDPNFGISTLDSAFGGFLYFKKVWQDANDAAGIRPEYITLNIYAHGYDNYAAADKIAIINLYKDKLDIIWTDNSHNFYWETDWTFMAGIGNTCLHYWVEEVAPTYPKDEYYLATIETNTYVDYYEGYIVSYEYFTKITNQYIDHPIYNIEITNTYIKEEDDIIFDVTKAWLDENNKTNERPENITLNIYGTNSLNARSAIKELITTKTINASSDQNEDNNFNTWEFNVDFKSNFKYFIIEEAEIENLEKGTYSLTNSNIVLISSANTFMIENKTNSRDYSVSLENSYTPLFNEVQFTINKTWLKDTASERPSAGIEFSIYGVETEGATTGGEFIGRLALNANDLVQGTNIWSVTSVIFETPYEYFYVTEAGMGDKYESVIGNITSIENEEIIEYTVPVTNTFKDIPLTITKIWDDENNKYLTRPETIIINLLQNGTEIKEITLNSSNIVETNKWQMNNITVPKYDNNGQAYTYTITEEINDELNYYYRAPIYYQEDLTVLNKRIWIIVETGDIPEEKYFIKIGKDIVNEDTLATDSDFEKVDLIKTDLYNFQITLKELNRTITKDDEGMIESYNGYSGNEFQGIITANGEITFSNLNPGKYEISENAVQYFNMVNLEKTTSTSGASLVKENNKYYIILSGITAQGENISINIENKIDEFRPYDDKEDKVNTFLFSRMPI